MPISGEPRGPKKYFVRFSTRKQHFLAFSLKNVRKRYVIVPNKVFSKSNVFLVI